MRYVGVWIGVDSDAYLPYNQVGAYTFRRGIPQDIDEPTFNLLSQTSGFQLFETPSTFLEIMKRSLFKER